MGDVDDVRSVHTDSSLFVREGARRVAVGARVLEHR